MSFIAAQEFNIMHGLPTQQKKRVETWVTPGVDGIGAQTLGQGGEEFDLVTVAYYSNNASANTAIDACNAIQGQVVTIVDDYGDEYISVLVKSLDTSNAKKPCIIAGVTTAVRVELRWRMIATVS